MRNLCVLALVVAISCLHCGRGYSQSPNLNIRGVDFKNFTYPWPAVLGSQDGLQWMGPDLKRHVRLFHGKADLRTREERTPDAPFSGLTLEGVSYAKLTGEAEDAVVVLRYDTGGTMYDYTVYIYELMNGNAELRGSFQAGDRAYRGLYRVFGKDGKLVVRLFDPDHRQGDCCSAGYLQYVFRWNGKVFERDGGIVKGPVRYNSRRAVSIFGLPEESSNTKEK